MAGQWASFKAGHVSISAPPWASTVVSPVACPSVDFPDCLFDDLHVEERGGYGRSRPFVKRPSYTPEPQRRFVVVRWLDCSQS